MGAAAIGVAKLRGLSTSQAKQAAVTAGNAVAPPGTCSKRQLEKKKTVQKLKILHKAKKAVKAEAGQKVMTQSTIIEKKEVGGKRRGEAKAKIQLRKNQKSE